MKAQKSEERSNSTEFPVAAEDMSVAGCKKQSKCERILKIYRHSNSTYINGYVENVPN